MVKLVEVKVEKVSELLSDRSLAKELKISLTHKEGYRYFVAQDKTIKAIAIVIPIARSTFPWKGIKAAEIKCLYVFESNRLKGIGSRLIAKIQKTLDCPLKATILPSTEKFYQKQGFKKVYQRGQYPVVATQVAEELCVQ